MADFADSNLPSFLADKDLPDNSCSSNNFGIGTNCLQVPDSSLRIRKNLPPTFPTFP